MIERTQAATRAAAWLSTLCLLAAWSGPVLCDTLPASPRATEDAAVPSAQDWKRLDWSQVSHDRYAGWFDAESYQVGALAGILLEQTGNRDWKARAMRGVPPAEALLRNRAQIPVARAPEVERLLETRVLPRAQAARGAIEPLLQRLKAPSAWFLAFAALPNLKNYSSGGLFRVDAYPDAARTRNGYLDYADDNLTLAKVPVSRQVTDEEGRVILCGPSMFGPQT